MITSDQIKQLRDATGISVMQCKKALEDAGGDMDKAIGFLKQKSSEVADKKSDRTLNAGVVEAYIHANGSIGAMVELNCETDFVGRNEEFRALAKDLVMHIVAMSPVDVEELLGQPFIKNPDETVTDLIKNKIQKFGEKIEIRKFVRFSLLDK